MKHKTIIYDQVLPTEFVQLSASRIAINISLPRRTDRTEQNSDCRGPSLKKRTFSAFKGENRQIIRIQQQTADNQLFVIVKKKMQKRLFIIVFILLVSYLSCLTCKPCSICSALDGVNRPDKIHQPVQNLTETPPEIPNQ